MEFIKAFAEAKKHGLTKEEFFPIWETEAKMKLTAEEAKLLQLQQNCIPVNTNDLNEWKYESVQQIDKLISEMRELKTRLDDVKHLLSCNFEQQKQQIQQQTDKFRQQFHRLSNNPEVCMTTLQVSAAEVSREGLRDLESQESEVTTKEQSRASSIEDSDNLANSEILSGDFASPKQEIRRQQAATATNEHRELNLPVKGSSVWDFYEQPWKSDEHDIGANETANSQPLSVVGTGEFADAISSMMTQDMIVHRHRSAREVNGKATPVYPSESNGLGGFQEVLKHDRKRHRDTVKTDRTMTFIPPNGAECFIPDFNVFQLTSKDFYTESLYTRPKACKVRLRLWFNKYGRLGVHLLVSEGVFDDRYRWPMIFSGNGSIFNHGSQTYTRLWVIESLMCPMPEKNKEITLGATVCLETGRDPCNDVTSDLLMRKRYVSDGDRLLFRWSIKAVERRVDRQATGLYLA